MTPSRVLIVGARGFVGAHTTRAFLRAGSTVHAFGPPMEDDLLADIAGDFTDIAGSIENRDEIAAAIGAAEPDLIVSFAAFSAGRQGLAKSGEAEAERAIAVGAGGFRNLLDVAQAAGVPRVLWSSSTVVFGPASDYGPAPLDEAAERRPRTVYGLTKVLAEQISQFYRDRHGMDVAAVRLPLIFGPGLWYRGAAAALAELFANAAPGAAFHCAATGDRFDLMYVNDTAAAFVALAAHEGPLAATYHINGFAVTYPEIIAAVTERVPGYRVAFEPVEAPIVYPLISAGKIAREIGFHPRFGLAEAVADLLPVQGVAAR